MMPLGDDNSRRRSLPTLTYLLIMTNILIFFLELLGGETFIENWAFVPSRFIADPVSNFVTLFTSMFMHASWGHLIGNMLYLWIFGDNVEDYFGKIKFLAFYVISGLFAIFAQLAFNPLSNLPNLGASGAIAGVLGAYILLWPRGRVDVLLGSTVTSMPALTVIGFWFILQFISGVGSIASTDQDGGVAYMAHIGGFIAGIVMAAIFRAFERPKADE